MIYNQITLTMDYTVNKPKIKATVVPTKSDSDIIFCLQLLSKTPTCLLHSC